VVQISPVIDKLLMRALAKEPDDRYQTARKFADALKRVMEGKPAEDPDEKPLPSAAPPAQAAPQAQPQNDEADTEFWNEVKDSDDPEEIGLYLDQFPNGRFAAKAKEKIAALGG
jgi:hypothetical protein